MFPIDNKSSKPIYEQIVDHIKEQVVRGALKEGEPMPSIRQLAAMLTVNPNTVSRAYQEMEREGIIETIRGKGTVIGKVRTGKVNEDKLEELNKQIKNICIELDYMGFDKNGILQHILTIYEELKKEE